MKQLATSCLVFILLLSAGCSSANKTASEVTNNPLVGAWAMEGESASAIMFTPGGDVTLDQGGIFTAINRFQNTNRASYNTRLVNTATYEYNGSDQLILNVMADWTGKGAGSRRAEDKSVASSIVFSVEDMGEMVKLTKVSMTQSGSGTDNTNDGEALSFMLKKM